MKSTNFKQPLIPVSWGELIDKITILEIKFAKIKDAFSIDSVKLELRLLLDILQNYPVIQELIAGQRKQLSLINSELWIIEDDIRDKDYKNEFDIKFIELARSVYRLNDERAKVKKEINLILKSEIIEIKSYSKSI